MTQNEFDKYKSIVEQMGKYELLHDYNMILLNMNLHMIKINMPLITDTVQNALEKARENN